MQKFVDTGERKMGKAATRRNPNSGKELRAKSLEQAAKCFYPWSIFEEINPLTNSAANPVFWLHIPKAGTSFANSIMAVGCAPSLPASAFLMDAIVDNCLKESSSKAAYLTRCHGSHCRLENDLIGHASSIVFTPDDVDYMVVLRSPNQRLISAYKFGLHGCPRCPHSLSLLQYAKWNMPDGGGDGGGGGAGVVTRMIAGEPFVGEYPSKDTITTATVRLRQFKFIGIFEKWEETVCVLHYLLRRGSARAVEFMNARPSAVRDGANGTSFRYDESELVNNGFVDWADEKIYSIAQSIFSEAAQRYYKAQSLHV